MALTRYDDTAAFQDFEPYAGVKENSRIIGIFLIKKGFDVTTLSEDPATWTAAITAKDVIIINPVTGNWPAAGENTQPGIGRTQTEFVSKAYDVPARHKGTNENLAFYNKLNKTKEYGAGFVFHDNTALIPASATAGDPLADPVVPDSFEVDLIDFFARLDGTEDLEGDRFILVNSRWTSADFPYAMKVPESLFPQ